MGHIEEIEQTLREILAKGDSGAVVGWVKERVLESYKNGLARARRNGVGAGRKSRYAGSGITRKPAGQPRYPHGN